LASELVTAGNFLQAVAAQAKAMKSLPPVEAWNPPYCGEIDMAIRRDGSWTYIGTPIARPALVRLFSTILRREEDGRYVLVTPAERVGIRVEDAPFLAVLMSVEGEGKCQTMRFTTNVADEVMAGPEHGLRFIVDAGTGGVAPYVHVRGRLEARINRPVYYDLVALGCDEPPLPASGERVGVRGLFGVWSGGVFFPMIESEALK
jgi:hypothetical protein